MTQNWERLGRRMAFDEMAAELAGMVAEFGGRQVLLIVGTDSQPALPIRFETVVALVTPAGVKAFNRRLATMGPMALAERMLTETAMSLMVADAICADLAGRGQPLHEGAVELHVDVGARGDSRKALRDAAGMVLGAGFGLKTKPEAWVASRIADRLTKQDRKRPVLPVYELVTAM